MVASRLGSRFQGYSLLGERVGFYDHFSLGMLVSWLLPIKKKRKVEIYQKEEEKSKGRQD